MVLRQDILSSAMCNIDEVRRVKEAEDSNDHVRSTNKYGLIMTEDKEDGEALELIAAELEARSSKNAGGMEIIVSHNIYNELEQSEIKDDS